MDLIYEVAKNNKFVTPCTAGTLSYVVWEDGSAMHVKYFLIQLVT